MNAARWRWWRVASVGVVAAGLGAAGLAAGLAATAWAAEGAAPPHVSPRAAAGAHAPPSEHVDTSDTGDYATL